MGPHTEPGAGFGGQDVTYEVEEDEYEFEDNDDYDPGPEVDDMGGMSEVEWGHPIG